MLETPKFQTCAEFRAHTCLGGGGVVLFLATNTGTEETHPRNLLFYLYRVIGSPVIYRFHRFDLKKCDASMQHPKLSAVQDGTIQF